MERATPLAGWDNFYVIIGSSAAALTGLQFVVITLVSERQTGGAPEIKAFASPTVVHFCAALLVSAILSSPWPSADGAAVALEICGVAGLVYGVIVLRRARATRDYRPVLEDWIWHVILPFIAYLAMLIGAVELHRGAAAGLFAIAAAALLLVFIGIHNAWDTVTYVAVENRQSRGAKPAGDQGSRT